jgi:hypothetical protein
MGGVAGLVRDAAARRIDGNNQIYAGMSFRF